MIDANSQFFAILTNVGMAKQANADALGIPWLITQMGVGDANPNGLADPPNPVPSASQTKLLNEWRRKPLNQLKIDPVNPAVIIAEQIIPADEGGKWIREIGLYDADGDLVAVANCAPSFKPLLSQGSGRTQIVRMNFIVTSTGNIQLKIDPAVVLATRSYVDAAILEVLPKNKTPGEFTRVKVNDRGIFVSGDNPETLAAMGIKDSYTKEEIEALVAQATESKRGTAKVATQVEVDAGADDAKFVTAKKLFGGFGMTVGQNGFIRLPSWLGGFTIQWGLNTVASNGDCVITLPTNYNTKHFQILSIAGAITGMAVAYTAISLSGAVIPHYVPSTGAKAGGGYNCVWISFGK
jgi:phage-related tail fiber protein